MGRGSAVNEDEAATQTIHDAVETRLWEITQAALHDPTAARQLKPIVKPGDERRGLSAGGEDILEPGVTPAWEHESDMLDDDDWDEMLSDKTADEILENYENEAGDLLEDVFSPSRAEGFCQLDLALRQSFDSATQDNDILDVHSLSHPHQRFLSLEDVELWDDILI